jgi:hypothetical protein
MADVRERVAAGVENVERTLRAVPPPSRCTELSALELAGVAILLHNFYNGVESILKQVLQSWSVEMPTGDSWHRDLLALARDRDLITTGTLKALAPYLAFRHFVSHAYALDLQAPRVEALVQSLNTAFDALKRDVSRAMRS